MAISTITYAVDKVKTTWAYLETVMPATYNEINRVVIELVTSNNALQALLDLKAPLASPALTGTPTAPTASVGTNTTQIATTAFVASTVSPLAPKNSPALTGIPTAPTAIAGTNNTQIASTAFVANAVYTSRKQAVGGVVKMAGGVGTIPLPSGASRANCQYAIWPMTGTSAGSAGWWINLSVNQSTGAIAYQNGDDDHTQSDGSVGYLCIY